MVTGVLTPQSVDTLSSQYFCDDGIVVVGTFQRESINGVPLGPSPRLAGPSCNGDADFNAVECVNSWDHLNKILVIRSGWLVSLFSSCQGDMDVFQGCSFEDLMR